MWGNMDSLIKMKQALMLFILSFFVVFLVYISNGTFSSANLDEDFLLLKNYSSNFSGDIVRVYDYSDEVSNDKYKVQVVAFDSKEKLFEWIIPKVENSLDNFSINENIVFIEENRNYFFWTNENKVIKVSIVESENPDLELLFNNVKPIDKKNYPKKLLINYLEQYESDCTVKGCYDDSVELEEKKREWRLWFLRPPRDIKDYRYYTDFIDKCPKSENELEKIRKKLFLSNGESEEIWKYCQDKEIYVIGGAEIPAQLKLCGKEIYNYLKTEGIAEYPPKIILDECILRQEFSETYYNVDSNDFNSFFVERDESLLKKIKLLDEVKDLQESEQISGRMEEILKEKRLNKNKSFVAEDSSSEFNDQTVDLSINQRLIYIKGGKKTESGSVWFE